MKIHVIVVKIFQSGGLFLAISPSWLIINVELGGVEKAEVSTYFYNVHPTL